MARARSAPAAGLFYQYDRFWPTFSVSAEDDSDEARMGFVRSQELTLRATVPLHRTFRAAHSLGLAWRRRRETVEQTDKPDRLDLGGLEASWTLSTARSFPYSISPVEGQRLRVAVVKEAPGLGSEVSLAKVLADGRAYTRLLRADDALALHLAGGFTLGSPAFVRSFAIGGFADGALFDVVGTNHSVLRGYPDDAFSGRRFLDANVEYRFPLAHPQRGYRLLPVFVRHLHGNRVRGRGACLERGLPLERRQDGGGRGLRRGRLRRSRPAPHPERRRGPRLRRPRRDTRLLPGRPRLLILEPPLEAFDLFRCPGKQMR
jgi:hypothetical protein